MKNAKNAATAPATVPAMGKATRKAMPPMEAVATLAAKVAEAAPVGADGIPFNPAQQAAETNMVRAAVAAEKGLRLAGEAIAECAALGCHTARGVTLAEYVRTTLGREGIATSTVYYLADIGFAIHAIGKAEAATVKADGALRELAVAARGDAAKVRDLLQTVKAAGKVTIDAVRNVAKGSASSGAAMDPARAAGILASKARKYAGGKEASAASVIALLEAAIERIQRVEAKAAEVKAAKAAKAKAARAKAKAAKAAK